MDARRVHANAQDLALIRCARVVIAAERYRRERADRLQSGVDDLVPAYLDRAPVDPYSGQPVRFVKEEGGYIVYSVGRNRRDDGGRLSRPDSVRREAESDGDLGVRVRYR